MKESLVKKTNKTVKHMHKKLKKSLKGKKFSPKGYIKAIGNPYGV